MAAAQGLRRRLAISASIGCGESAGVHESPTHRDVGHRQPVGSAQQIRAYPGQTDIGQAFARAGLDIVPEAFLQPTYADPGNLGHIARRPWTAWVVMHLIEHPFDDARPQRWAPGVGIRYRRENERGGDRATKLVANQWMLVGHRLGGQRPHELQPVRGGSLGQVQAVGQPG